MQRRTKLALAAVVTVPLITAHPAIAQMSNTIPARPGIGGLVGASLTSDENSGGLSIDLAPMIEVPVAPTWLVRAEGSRMNWIFEDTPARTDTVTLRRINVAAVRTYESPQDPGFRTYVFGGGGHYRWGYAVPPQELHRLKTWGLYGGGDFEFPLKGPRLTVGGEVQLHAVGDPGIPELHDSPYWYVLLVGTASVRIKLYL